MDASPCGGASFLFMRCFFQRRRSAAHVRRCVYPRRCRGLTEDVTARGRLLGLWLRLAVETVLRALMMLELKLCPKYVEEHIFLLTTL